MPYLDCMPQRPHPDRVNPVYRAGYTLPRHAPQIRLSHHLHQGIEADLRFQPRWGP